MPQLQNQLELPRCPHCSVDHPNLGILNQLETHNHAGKHRRWWGVYSCKRCGGLVIAATPFGPQAEISECYPARPDVDLAVPERARQYLAQALDSLHVPAGAIMLAASSVDAMLKAKEYREGSLYARIDQAATDHLITADVAAWAHSVRLDANDQRHADDAVALPEPEDAKRVVDFAVALADILFVLPSRVSRGLTGK